MKNEEWNSLEWHNVYTYAKGRIYESINVFMDRIRDKDRFSYYESYEPREYVFNLVWNEIIDTSNMISTYARRYFR